MTSSPDYEFRLGKDRMLKGTGWRGILALALLTMPFVLMAWQSPTLLKRVLHALEF